MLITIIIRDRFKIWNFNGKMVILNGNHWKLWLLMIRYHVTCIKNKRVCFIRVFGNHWIIMMCHMTQTHTSYLLKIYIPHQIPQSFSMVIRYPTDIRNLLWLITKTITWNGKIPFKMSYRRSIFTIFYVWKLLIVFNISPKMYVFLV